MQFGYQFIFVLPDKNNLPLLPIVTGITLLKKLTEKDFGEEGKQETTHLGMARPNTTLPQEVAEPTPDTTKYLNADTIYSDRRHPMEAGDEDGYWDGWTDGAEARLLKIKGKEAKRSFDPSSHYPTDSQRVEYKIAYTNAYEFGFNEGYSN